MTLKNKKRIKKLLLICGILLVLINLLAYLHAYKFTHFSTKKIERTGKPEDLSFLKKLTVLIFGISNPKPKSDTLPDRPFKKIKIAARGNKKIDCWLVNVDKPKGTVILFHGYGSSKSALLEESKVLTNLKYNTLLVDFCGHGESEGNQTSFGYHETLDVLAAYNYVKKSREKGVIILFGTSMGAVAILRAVSQYQLKPDALILECPFSSLLKTVKNRFKIMNLPSFPFAELLVFWGSAQNNFWGFNHNSVKYAKQIDIPTLLNYGLKDNCVDPNEIENIFNQLRGYKERKFFETCGHESYCKKEPAKWSKTVEAFLDGKK